MNNSNFSNNISRRNFVGASAALATGVAAGNVFAAGSDKIRVGWVGCGNRGSMIMAYLLNDNPGVELVAIGDMFQDKVDSALKTLKKKGVSDDKVTATKGKIFLGFDSYQKVIDSGVDLVFLSTPPHFRPAHLEAAISAGKHVFAEKPLAVDPVGARKIIETSRKAKEKGLCVMVGAQRRRTPSYLEIIKRIHDGQIGDVVGAQVYWNWGFQDWHYEKRQPGWSDMEWMIRCWPYFTWLSGDHLVEQHFHNIDVMNWAIGSIPKKALAIGGRQARTEKGYGYIWDHFAVEWEYENGVRTMSMASQINGTTQRIGERIVGTKGVAFLDKGRIEGESPWEYTSDLPREKADGSRNQFVTLVKAIRENNPYNEGEEVAMTNMTALLGRTAAYTGRELNMSWLLKNSKLDLTPVQEYKLGPVPTPSVAIPGKTPLA